ncbi:unnamed protein product [Phytophthora lilii]|uniref:Unnamed protein product n=1 Tax=Phytophthora lilii TaxID=2077276 RepID=A0A9W6TBN3_9STRA|nr:unnamed protein product [Phytophthora lilii]
MGASQSPAQLQPVREHAALLNTGAGLIVRIPDPVSGVSTYEHNQRDMATPTALINETEGGSRGSQQTHVAVVKPGDRNQTLKGSIVYLKKTSRSVMSPPHSS